MRKLLILIFMLSVTSAHAYDKTMGGCVSGNDCFLLNAYSTSPQGNVITGLGAADVVAYVECVGDAKTTIDVDASGETWAEEGSGTYSLITDDTIAFDKGDECRAWLEGAGTYAGLLAYWPNKFIAYGDITCDVSAATSGISFTVASCTDESGDSISLVDDKWIGYLMKATTNGASQCNVIGEDVMVEDFASDGTVTIREELADAGCSATPNTSNCGIQIP